MAKQVPAPRETAAPVVFALSAAPAHPSRPVRAGVALLVVLALVAIMMIVGVWFLRSSVQTKNVFALYFRDDITRLIAESALAEWRARFPTQRTANAALRQLLENPRTAPAPVTISPNELPKTAIIADRIAGAGRWTLGGHVSIHQVDDQLLETVGGVQKRGTFGREYQGILRVRFAVGYGAPGQGPADFTYDFDLKVTCLRSRPADRLNRGYTSSALNDYVLYVRDGRNEFRFLTNWQSRNADRTLRLAHADPARKGLVFLGEAPADTVEATGRLGFVETTERLISSPPSPPLVGRTGPVDFHRFLPFAAAQMRSHRFASPDDFYASSFFEQGVLRLEGIHLVHCPAGPLVIRRGTTYKGHGIVIAMGEIQIEGGLTRQGPTDGPCFLYTWTGNIRANTVEEGRIEASLIALRYDHDPANYNGPAGRVDFSQRRAEVLGSLVVDRLHLESMAPNASNTIVYDSQALSGEELYAVTLGGQLRGMNVVFDNREAL